MVSINNKMDMEVWLVYVALCVGHGQIDAGAVYTAGLLHKFKKNSCVQAVKQIMISAVISSISASIEACAMPCDFPDDGV